MTDVGGAVKPDCPKCRSKFVATIAYGYDSSNPAFVDGLHRGEIVLAEADLSGAAARLAFACRSCGHKWGLAGPSSAGRRPNGAP